MRVYDNQPSGTIARARNLRRQATEAEKRLLRALKEAPPTLKWRFQVPIGPYYAAFLSFGAKLVIEVDGGQHDEARRYDQQRTRSINAEGYQVIRFWNNDVLDNADGVIAQISLSLREREGAAQRRKGEGDARPALKAPSPSPSHAATRRGPLPLPRGEEP